MSSLSHGALISVKSILVEHSTLCNVHNFHMDDEERGENDPMDGWRILHHRLQGISHCIVVEQHNEHSIKSNFMNESSYSCMPESSLGSLYVGEGVHNENIEQSHCYFLYKRGGNVYFKLPSYYL